MFKIREKKLTNIKISEQKFRQILPFPLSKRQNPVKKQKKGPCKDEASDCKRLKSLCHDADVKDLMLKECTKSCGYCKDAKGKACFYITFSIFLKE